MIEVPNAPTQAKGPNAVTLASVCKEVGCILLHTSSRYEKFHIEKMQNGKLKISPWEAGKPSLSENRIKFVRLLRKPQEQIHAALKQRFKFLDMRHLPNSLLQPLSKKILARYGMADEYKDTPKINFLVTVCCSMLNEYHPGFNPLSLDDCMEVRTAQIIVKRLFLENPFLHPEIWPIDFTIARPGHHWKELTVKEWKEDHIFNFPFPQLNKGQINPIAIELTSSVHALHKADGILTYMKQLLLKNEDLTREETVNALQQSPDEWKIQFMEIKTPADFVPTAECPTWIPSWWDTRFGPWYDMTLVRCKVPPSNRTAINANYHYPVIAFGEVPSDRLMVRHPYDLVYFTHCFRCPSKNGSIAMDRHEAALLKLLSFQDEYRPTSRTVNILNTVAQPKRQMIKILPNIDHSKNIPNFVARKSRNTRLMRKGSVNPLYYTPCEVIHRRQQQEDTDNVTSNDHQTQSSLDPNCFEDDQTSSEVVEACGDTSVENFNSSTSSLLVLNEDFFQEYLQTLNPNDIAPIPDRSENHLQNVDEFSVTHLQLCGLLNHSNVCALISLMLCLHRIGLKNHVQATSIPDLMLTRTLSALPSPYPFSLQSFIEVWNQDESLPNIYAGYSDVAALTESILSSLNFIHSSINPPFLTKFLGTFLCSGCGTDYRQVAKWDEQIWSIIPIIPLPSSDEALDVMDLVDAYLAQPIETRCINQQCRRRIDNGKLDPMPGMFSIVGFNRLEFVDDQTRKYATPLRLDTDRDNPLFGELVSIICHRGSVNTGHFVSYHQVNGRWYLNDDSKRCKLVTNPLNLQGVEATETVELLFFRNRNQMTL